MAKHKYGSVLEMFLGRDGMGQLRYPYHRCTSLDQRLPYHHYSNPVYDTPQTTYGDETAPAVEGAYSDRLRGWSQAKYDAAWRAVAETSKGTPRAVQEMLSAYFGRPVALVSIQTQTAADGWPLSYYRWNWAPTEEAPDARP